MSDYRNTVARDRDEWLASEEGMHCQDGTATGIYLRNRLEAAFVAGHAKGRGRGVRAGLEAAANSAHERGAHNGIATPGITSWQDVAHWLRSIDAEAVAKEAADAAE